MVRLKNPSKNQKTKLLFPFMFQFNIILCFKPNETEELMKNKLKILERYL